VGRDWLFSVRDNGTGVDPQQHREIFHAASGARELPGCRMSFCGSIRLIR
jgi:hypothetical protein